LLPFGYQAACVRGSASKIDALMLREYMNAGCALPDPGKPRDFQGGYTDIFKRGVVRNVHHCDARSLYPSIMLERKIAPSGDHLGAFLKLLEKFRAFRLSAKEKMNSARDARERAHFDSQQSALKILINSFYGYLGFAQARFNDFEAAEAVAAEGRAILSGMVDWLRKHGAEPVEIDTDGVYFVPPAFKTKNELAVFRDSLRDSLPAGIEVEFDGEYAAMFSYKMKNYALLDSSGVVTIRGAALKSRGMEPYLRDFLKELLRLKLEMREKEIPALRDKYEKAIRDGDLGVKRLAKTEVLREAPSAYAARIAAGGRGRNAAYELALASGHDYQAGDQLSYYITGSSKKVAAHSAARLVSEWDPAERDENTAYYIAKLNALYDRFAADDDADG
jgi:DNA polymerase, archaea type